MVLLLEITIREVNRKPRKLSLMGLLAFTEIMALQISDDTFYMVQIPSEKTLHETEDGAIAHLKENIDNVDPDSDEVSVVRVSVDGNDWTIAEMSWQNIALQLMGED